MWVPETVWAPAWVSWRRSSDHMVWAPLPPGRDNDVTIEVAVTDIPDEYWVAVPADHFLDDDISVAVVVDDSERVRVVDAAEPVGNVVIKNNIVVNNVIDIDYVRKVTHKDVKTVTVKETDDPTKAGKGSGDQVAIFNSEVKEDRDAKPKDVKDVEAVRQEQAQKKEGEQQGTETQPSQGEQGQDQITKPTPGEKPTRIRIGLSG